MQPLHHKKRKTSHDSDSDEEFVEPKKSKPSRNDSLSKEVSKTNLVARTVRGLLNRCTPSNLEGIASQLLDIYNSNSRNEVNEHLANNILSSCCNENTTISVNIMGNSNSQTQMTSNLILTHAALLSALHYLVGIEVGAFFMEKAVSTFLEHYHKLSEESNKDKEPNIQQLRNIEVAEKISTKLVLLFSVLLDFNVIFSGFIYDLVHKFVERFREIDIMLILVILKCKIVHNLNSLADAGYELRKEDPASFKNIIISVQQKHKEFSEKSTEETEMSAKVKYMIETINLLKNNKVANSTQTIEDISNSTLRKTLAHFISKNGKSMEKGSSSGSVNKNVNILRVGLQDWTAVSEKGRWWLVGSAWSSGSADVKKNSKNEEVKEKGLNDKIMELARAQRMNTDLRRSVFAILMTSEDFVDAFEKLMKLNLQDKQDREVIYVLIHCCMQEKTYNEYYSHLASKLCAVNHNYRITFQFSIWDKIKQMNEKGALTPRAVSNLANLFAHLVSSLSLSLSVLKIMEWNKLTALSSLFLKTAMNIILTKNSEEVVRSIFERVANPKNSKEAVPESDGLKEGLILFFVQEELHRLSNTTPETKQRDSLFIKRSKIAKRILEKSNETDFLNLM